MKAHPFIVGQLAHYQEFVDLHPDFAKAFAFLSDSAAALSPGRYEIDGDRLFCLISRGAAKERSAARLEAHRKYIDIQYIISGADEMGWKAVKECQNIDAAYDEGKDIEFYRDAPTLWKTVPAGSFAIFFPKDAHAPMTGQGEIHKAVVKVLINDRKEK